MGFVMAGVRYGLNRFDLVAREEGHFHATSDAAGFLWGEIRKLPAYATFTARNRGQRKAPHPEMNSDQIVSALPGLDAGLDTYEIDLPAFWTHVATTGYPRHYAAGPMADGGAYEQKLLEYFVSLDLLGIAASDVVIDVASERSLFPSVVRSMTGATVYRQDLIYPPGVDGDRIGGDAAAMPIPDNFADKLVLHNAYEHFEGRADIDFLKEAWRVLKPGGMLCVAPINLAEHHSILTDPLVDRQGVEWDEGAEVIEWPWFHNRFGRFYDAPALQSRLLEPAVELGFETTIFRVVNAHDVSPHAYLHFVLMMRKPY